MGDQKRAEVVGHNLLSHPHAWLLLLEVWISLTLASGREGWNLLFGSPVTPCIRAGLGHWRL